MILKARRYLTKKALKTLYHSFICPSLTYCNHIWGSTYQTYLMKLQKLQNRILRIICNTNRRDHVRPLYRHLAYFSWVISTSTWYVVLCSACAIIMFLVCFTPFSKGIVNSIIMKPEQLITFMFHCSHWPCKDWDKVQGSYIMECHIKSWSWPWIFRSHVCKISQEICWCTAMTTVKKFF